MEEWGRMYALALNVPMDGSVCPACRKDIPRVLLTVSMFLGGRRYLGSIRECCVHGCTNQVHASLHKTTKDDMQQALVG